MSKTADYLYFLAQYQLVKATDWLIMNPYRTLALGVALHHPTGRTIVKTVVTHYTRQAIGDIRMWGGLLGRHVFAPMLPTSAQVVAATRVTAVGAAAGAAYLVATNPERTYDFLTSEDRISDDGETYLTPGFFFAGYA